MSEQKMTGRLFVSAIAKFVLGAVLVGALIFLPAGSLHYPAGWRLMLILFVPMFLAGIVMMLRNPGLLKSRLNAKENEKEQQSVVKLSGLMFIAGFVLAGLDYRFGWLPLPGWVSWLGTFLFLASYALYAEVLRENTYLSRIIEVQQGQKVIDTGLYGIVRHPMYAVTLVLFVSMPLVLGSMIALVCFLAYPFIIAKRIRNEEQVLEAQLEGYREYKQKVRYRLIPYIW